MTGILWAVLVLILCAIAFLFGLILGVVTASEKAPPSTVLRLVDRDDVA